jgi:hypothetical protein
VSKALKIEVDLVQCQVLGKGTALLLGLITHVCQKPETAKEFDLAMQQINGYWWVASSHTALGHSLGVTRVTIGQRLTQLLQAGCILIAEGKGQVSLYRHASPSTSKPPLPAPVDPLKQRVNHEFTPLHCRRFFPPRGGGVRYVCDQHGGLPRSPLAPWQCPRLPRQVGGGLMPRQTTARQYPPDNQWVLSANSNNKHEWGVLTVLSWEPGDKEALVLAANQKLRPKPLLIAVTRLQPYGGGSDAA